MARLTSSASSLPSSSVLLLLVLPLIALPLASAAQISWLSASVGGSWHDAANWDLNRVPAADDVVGLPVTGLPSALNVTITSPVTVFALVVGGTTRLEVIATTLNITGAVVLLDGELALSAASLAAPLGLSGPSNGLLSLSAAASVSASYVDVSVMRVTGGAAAAAQVSAASVSVAVLQLTAPDDACGGPSGELSVVGSLTVAQEVAYLFSSASGNGSLVRVSGQFNCSSCAFALDLTQPGLPIALRSVVRFATLASRALPGAYGAYPNIYPCGFYTPGGATAILARAGSHNDSAFCVNFTSPFAIGAVKELQSGCPSALCDAGWSGAACATPQCPNDCSGRGACVTAPTPVCSCTAPYSGPDCSSGGKAKGGWNTRAKIAVGLGVGIFALSLCIALGFLVLWIIQMGPRRA